MRKLIWLALGLGAAHLLKQQALKRGVTPSGLLSNLAANTVARLRAEQAAPPA